MGLGGRCTGKLYRLGLDHGYLSWSGCCISALVMRYLTGVGINGGALMIVCVVRGEGDEEVGLQFCSVTIMLEECLHA